MFAEKFNLTLQSVLNFGKKYAIFILAFVIGVLIVFPSAYFHYFDSSYRGIEFFGSSDEAIYLAQIQEVYDGHYSFGNVYLSDLKDSPSVQQSLSSFLVMAMGRIGGMDAPAVNIVTKFVLPFILTLLVYTFFRNLSGRRNLALLLTVFFMLGPATLIFLNPAAWIPFFKDGALLGVDLKFLTYARPINPQVSSLFFFGYLVCFWKFLYEEKRRVYGTLAAVILGLAFYTYFFSWSLLFTLNGALGLWYLIKKDWAQCKKIIAVTAGAILLGLPYFMNTLDVLNSPWYTQVTHRFGVAEGHTFIFSRIWWGVFFATLFLYREWDNRKIFILGWLASAFIVTNQQLITGRTVPIPSHYHWYYVAPLGGALLIYLVFRQLEKFVSKRIFYACFVFLFILFFSSAIILQRQSYLSQRDSFADSQRYAPALFWLEQNLPKDSVIFGNEAVYQLVVAYTNKNVYYHGGAGDFLINEDRLKHYLFTYLYLKGIGKDEMRAYINNNRDQVGAWLFSQSYRVSNGCYGCFPDTVIDTLVSGYADFVQHDFVNELKKFPVDYVVWDKEDNPEWAMDRFFNQSVYADGQIVIYQVNP
ncbi:MAG: hypothetical protein Q7S66_03335 [bacterium]|nr:hypothetical protein [bacterium]